MTAREIIYDVREKLKFSTDDIDITDEYLYHLINVKRALLLKQRFAKTSRNIPEEVKQIICVSLEKISDVEGLCDEYHKVVKSTLPIPGMMEIGGRSSIISIRVPSILEQHVSIISMERMPNIGYNKYLKGIIYAALDADNYLYLKTADSPTLLESVKLIGVFSNPEKAHMQSCIKEDEALCDYMDAEYPIEPYIVSDTVNLIVQELGATLKIPEDKINNADESNR
jgi:hypothetical protein